MFFNKPPPPSLLLLLLLLLLLFFSSSLRTPSVGRGQCWRWPRSRQPWSGRGAPPWWDSFCRREGETSIHRKSPQCDSWALQGWDNGVYPAFRSISLSITAESEGYSQFPSPGTFKRPTWNENWWNRSWRGWNILILVQSVGQPLWVLPFPQCSVNWTLTHIFQTQWLSAAVFL